MWLYVYLRHTHTHTHQQSSVSNWNFYSQCLNIPFNETTQHTTPVRQTPGELVFDGNNNVFEIASTLNTKLGKIRPHKANATQRRLVGVGGFWDNAIAYNGNEVISNEIETLLEIYCSCSS